MTTGLLCSCVGLADELGMFGCARPELGFGHELSAPHPRALTQFQNVILLASNVPDFLVILVFWLKLDTLSVFRLISLVVNWADTF